MTSYDQEKLLDGFYSHLIHYYKNEIDSINKFINILEKYKENKKEVEELMDALQQMSNNELVTVLNILNLKKNN